MIYVLTIYTLVAIINLPPLIKNGQKRELFAFIAFFIVAFVLSLLYAMDIEIPSPMEGLKYLIEDFMGLKYPEPK
ncbi:MAG: hypothetical protein GX193_01270 [Clostridiales bacterium]|nr:hypothetical protein [Clostridiales bacterium]